MFFGTHLHHLFAGDEIHCFLQLRIGLVVSFCLVGTVSVAADYRVAGGAEYVDIFVAYQLVDLYVCTIFRAQRNCSV